MHCPVQQYYVNIKTLHTYWGSVGLEQNTLRKRLEKIIDELNKLNKTTKKVLKIGIVCFLALFAAGTMLIAVNHTFLGFDRYIEFYGQSIVKSAFTVLAEITIGSLIIDYVFRH